MKEKLEKLNKEIKISSKDIREFLEEYKINKIENEFNKRVITLIIASLGLITALAWDETLKDIYVKLFGNLDNLSSKIFYSLTITLLSVIISIIATKKIRKRNRRK